MFPACECTHTSAHACMYACAYWGQILASGIFSCFSPSILSWDFSLCLEYTNSGRVHSAWNIHWWPSIPNHRGLVHSWASASFGYTQCLQNVPEFHKILSADQIYFLWGIKGLLGSGPQNKQNVKWEQAGVFWDVSLIWNKSTQKAWDSLIVQSKQRARSISDMNAKLAGWTSWEAAWLRPGKDKSGAENTMPVLTSTALFFVLTRASSHNRLGNNFIYISMSRSDQIHCSDYTRWKNPGHFWA